VSVGFGPSECDVFRAEALPWGGDASGATSPDGSAQGEAKWIF